MDITKQHARPLQSVLYAVGVTPLLIALTYTKKGSKPASDAPTVSKNILHGTGDAPSGSTEYRPHSQSKNHRHELVLQLLGLETLHLELPLLPQQKGVLDQLLLQGKGFTPRKS